MVAEYLTSLKVAWEVAKGLKIATEALDDANIKFQIANLISALADAKIEASENTEKISKLEKIINRRKSFIFRDGRYYLNEDGSEEEGPFCPCCYDSKSKEVHLHGYGSGATTEWFCKVCKQDFS